MKLGEDETVDALLEEAMDWLLRLQDAPRDAEADRLFDVWLARSPAHARAWEKACGAWRLMREVPPVHAHLWQPALAAPARRRILGRSGGASRRRPARWVAAGLAAAAAVLLLLLAAPAIRLHMEADHVTAAKESRAITLADGTVVTLGADSAIATSLRSDERRVKLLSGEAFFDVTHDAARPFVVDAGGVDITVLGTAFDVQLASHTATVELARGSVRVAYEGTSAVLAPGEKMAVDRQTGAVARSAIEQADIGAWRSGYLFVNGATIAAVVEQLQRYHTAWIKVPDGVLATQKVTGLYDLTDPDRALRALVQPYGGQVHHISPYLRILSRL